MSLAKMVIWFAGLLFVLYGAGFTIAPIELATFVTGGAPDTASGAIDMRATYGGMTIAVGLLILLLGSRPASISLALLAIAIVLIAMAATRLLGFVVDGDPNTLMYVYLVTEVLGALLSLYVRRITAPVPSE